MPSIGQLQGWAWELIVFGLKQARSCIFAGSFFFLLFVSKYLPLGDLPRYDFLFISAVLLQVILYLTKVETWDEVKTIFLFHIIGFVLETFKTHPAVGSWSYLAQSWRIMKTELEDFPPYPWVLALCAAIYLNFFTNFFIPDLRIILIPAVFLLFARTTVYFTVIKEKRHMPLALAYCLIAFFIWIAENISTFYGAWQYPNQVHVWSVVSTNKITSWFLLVIISFIIVAYLKHYKKDVLRR